MDDRTFLIIFFGINALMWFSVVMRIGEINNHFSEMQKKQNDLIDKQTDYFHKVHEMMREMTSMNVSAMGTFISQVSTILEQQGKRHETDSRK